MTTASHAEWTEQSLNALRSKSGCDVLRDDASRASVAQDFGNIVVGSPSARAIPKSRDQIASVISFAYEHGLCLTARGGGNSQGGQAVAANAVTLDLSQLSNIGVVDSSAGTIECDAGSRWRDVLAATAAKGWIPCSMPLNLDLTVGGTLSVGGVSDSSHRLGPAVAHVAKLEVVTGEGKVEACARDHRSPLFDATLAGLGRCAVITKATLRLRPLMPCVRKFFLLYDSVEPWLEDQSRLVSAGRCDYLEAFCSASVQGLRRTARGRQPFPHWFYGLHATFESEVGKEPTASQALDGLRPYRVLHVEDDDVVSHAARVDGRLAMMRKVGGDRMPHPWFECFVPAEALSTLVPRLLEIIPLSLGDGHRVFFMASDQLPRFFMVPESRQVAGFAVLPVGVPPPLLEGALAAIENAQGVVRAAGGKRYLSGWLGRMPSANWQAHFGARYGEWIEAKRTFDPRGVFDAALFAANRD